MRIGLDLDHTVYGFPEFFREFIPAMVARGHEIVCSSNHTIEQWHREDIERLTALGIDPGLFDTSLMPRQPVTGTTKEKRQNHKAPLADQLDIVFDDHADIFQPLTKTPVFKCPGKLSTDWLESKRHRKEQHGIQKSTQGQT